MVDFLLEIGTEEIPAFYVEPACQDLADRLAAGLEEAGLLPGPAEGAGSPATRGSVRWAATPRRLSLFIAGLAEKQPDREEDVSGPPEKAAFDAEGRPTKAAVGFARGQGAGPEAIEVRDTPKGRYCFIHKKIPGRSAAAVLAELVPALIGRVHFPKSMRWPRHGEAAAAAPEREGGGGERFSFARPIRSIAALLGTEVVSFSVNGVVSGRAVRGHPFLAPEPFDLESADFDAYLAALEERFVIADVKKRRDRVRAGVEEVLRRYGAELKEKALVDEVTNLVEFPVVVEGAFDESFLSLPAAVVRSAMMDHQRYFPVEDAEGTLLARFATVCNRSERFAAGIREGNERVLAARLADAVFFLREDRKVSLADRVESLKGMVYQEKLGTYFDRVERIAKLAAFIAGELGLPPGEKEDCLRAALLCKCDLTTEMVGEFPNLQGTVGREYALMDGEKPSVAAAVEEHYLPAFAGDSLPSTTAGKVLALAEKFDAVAGCFAAGLAPSGSQDPYGLRRQALGIIRIVLESGLDLSLRKTVNHAASALPRGLPDAGIVASRVLDFFWDRIYNFCVDRRYRYDLVKAALATGYDDLKVFFERLEALKILSKDPGWEDLVTVVQRTYNIYRKADEVGELDPDRLEAPEEKEVHRLFEERRGVFLDLVGKRDFAGASREFAGTFVGPVHTFFDKVFVNVEDEAVRNNRLALMKALNRLYTENIADLSKVVME